MPADRFASAAAGHSRSRRANARRNSADGASEKISPPGADILLGAMPTYVYKFVETGETIEVQQSFSDDSLTEAVHPETGETMAVKKVFQPVGVTFKGEGFYKTDSRAGKKSSSSSESSSTSSDSSSGSSETSGASTKSDTSSTASSSSSGSSSSGSSSSGSSGD
jgi:predicted nucleic acid-binding Zn ribbon protein